MDAQRRMSLVLVEKAERLQEPPTVSVGEVSATERFQELGRDFQRMVAGHLLVRGEMLGLHGRKLRLVDVVFTSFTVSRLGVGGNLQEVVLGKLVSTLLSRSLDACAHLRRIRPSILFGNGGCLWRAHRQISLKPTLARSGRPAPPTVPRRAAPA